jgi:hypothetical protein
MTKAPTKDEALEYHLASFDDGDGILTVLREVALEIPVSLDAPEHDEIIRIIIAECCQSGQSWVAVDANGTVVGFVLAKPDRLERFLHRNEALSLRYVAVSKARRQEGIFGTLMGKLMAKGVPLTATVLHTNRCNMSDRLLKFGFTKEKSDAKQVELRRGANRLS